jgi:hypothetical protein
VVEEGGSEPSEDWVGEEIDVQDCQDEELGG